MASGKASSNTQHLGRARGWHAGRSRSGWGAYLTLPPDHSGSTRNAPASLRTIACRFQWLGCPISRSC